MNSSDEAEVADFDGSVARKEDVARLQVPEMEELTKI